MDTEIKVQIKVKKFDDIDKSEVTLLLTCLTIVRMYVQKVIINCPCDICNKHLAKKVRKAFRFGHADDVREGVSHIQMFFFNQAKGSQ